MPTDELTRLIKPGTNIHRDGVHVVARLAALAGPAGICISGRVQDAIRDQLPYTFADIGQQNLDLGAPMHCYVMSADAVAAKPRVAGRMQRDATSRFARLRSAGIAACLFANVAIGAAALWAWLDADSSTAPIIAPVTAGLHMPFGRTPMSGLRCNLHPPAA